MSSFLFTSYYNVMSSLKSVLCFGDRTTRSETSTETQCVFWWRKLMLAKNQNFFNSQKSIPAKYKELLVPIRDQKKSLFLWNSKSFFAVYQSSLQIIKSR